MDAAERPIQRADFEAGERHLDDGVLLRALLELAESAERNRRESGADTPEDGPLPEAA